MFVGFWQLSIATGTPLWRNGPPEKPVLCNACGSRWRTKGTLAKYTPLHARAETDDYDDQRVSRVKSISINKKKEVALLKRKQNHDNVVSGGFAPDYNQGYQKVVDEDISNRSSSGSAISNSESCAQFGYGGMDASDLTGWIKIFLHNWLQQHLSFWNKYWFYCLSRFILAQSRRG